MLPIPFSSTITNVHGNDEGCVRAESKPIIIIYRIPFSFANNLMSENELKNPGIYFLVRMVGRKMLDRVIATMADQDLPDPV